MSLLILVTWNLSCTGPVSLTLASGAADQQLLLTILSEHAISVNFELVADRLGCTPRAVQERLKKLKKMASEHTGGVHGVPAPSPITPTKAPTKKNAGKDESPSSAKKRKVATPRSLKAAKSVKTGKTATGIAADTSGESTDTISMAQGVKLEDDGDNQGYMDALEVGVLFQQCT